MDDHSGVYPPMPGPLLIAQSNTLQSLAVLNFVTLCCGVVSLPLSCLSSPSLARTGRCVSGGCPLGVRWLAGGVRRVSGAGVCVSGACPTGGCPTRCDPVCAPFLGDDPPLSHRWPTFPLSTVSAGCPVVGCSGARNARPVSAAGVGMVMSG